MKSSPSLDCPAPEALVDHVYDGPIAEVASHLRQCAECASEVVEMFKRRELVAGAGDVAGAVVAAPVAAPALPDDLWRRLRSVRRRTPDSRGIASAFDWVGPTDSVS